MEESEKMRMRGVSAVVTAAAVLLALGRPGQAALPQGTGTPTPEKVEELAALGRLWGEVELVHPWLYSRDHDIDWDAALLAALPAAIEARGTEEFRAAVVELLAVLDDPLTRVLLPETLAASHVSVAATASFERDGSGIVLIRAPVSDGGTEMLARLAREPHEPALAGVILDLRGPVEAGVLEPYRAAFETALESVLHGRCLMPAWRHVKHSGFPPVRGTTSGGYTLEFQSPPPRWLEGKAEREIPLAIVVDEQPRGIGDHLLALQLAGLPTIVLESEAHALDERGDAAVVGFELPHGMRAEIRASQRIRPYSMWVGPDLRLPPDADRGEALRQARAFVSGALVPRRPSYSATQLELQRRPMRDYAGLTELTREHRLLGLFRYWCTLHAFQPYLHLLERPWEETLRDFVPRFLAAEDSSAYERALAEVAACTQDSHSYAIGPFLLQAYGTAVPKVALRFVEDRPVVVAVLDPAIEGVSVGDVLLSVDGSPIEDRIEALRPLMAYSTPQAAHDKLRDVLLSGEKGTLARATFEGPRGIRECSLARTEEYVQGTRSTPVFGILPSGHGYVDLERLQVAQVPEAFEAVADAPALVFDMRGYPNGTALAVATRLGDGDAPVAAVFYRNQLGADGPGVRSSLRFEQSVPERPEGVLSFQGPVVVLIDERAISQAEHLCLHLKAAAKRITFVGTPTNGTNGDVTNGLLPGGIRFGFTGHDVRFPDESQLQRRGIQPDILVAPTIAGIRAGRDEVLERAVRFLETGK